MSPTDPLFTGNAVAVSAAAPLAAGAPKAVGNDFDTLMTQHMSDRAPPEPVASDDTVNAPTPSADKAPQETAAPAAEKPASQASKDSSAAKDSAETPKAPTPQIAATDEKTTQVEKPAKVLKSGEDDLAVPTEGIVVPVQAVVAAVAPATSGANQTEAANVALTEAPAPEVKGQIAPSSAAPLLAKPTVRKPDAVPALAQATGDAAPAVEEAFADLLGKAVKGAAKASDGDAQDDTTSGDGGTDDAPQAQPTVAQAKSVIAKAGSVLEAFQPALQPVQTTDTGTSAAVQPQTAASPSADASVSTAFSLQSLQDTSGSYSAVGASPTAASNMSRAAVETLSALSMQISKRLSEGSTKFAIELHPADLGKVEVTLNIARDGKTTAHLRFDTPITAAAFSSQEGELRQQLAQTGLTFDKDSLSFSSRDGGAGLGASLADQQGSQSQGQARQAARALEAAGKAAEETDANAALDVALANFRNRSSQSLALNLIV